MKTDKQVKGVSGTLVVQAVVNNHWKSDWQKIDQENDDAIDGIIHIRKNGELTGEMIYVQVKSGDGYEVVTANRPGIIGINVGEMHIYKHKPRWKILKGAVIMVFVNDEGRAFWTDLKSTDSYSKENKSIILIPRGQTFGAHSKGHFRKIGGFHADEKYLPVIRLNRADFSYWQMSVAVNQVARAFYKEWSNATSIDRTHPDLGEVVVNRSGCRHISRQKRGPDKIIQSWQLLPAAKKMITLVTKAYQVKKSVIADNVDGYILKDYISLRAKIIFPNRHSSDVQVVLRRKRIVDKVNNTIDQQTWFYSVYEPCRSLQE